MGKPPKSKADEYLSLRLVDTIPPRSHIGFVVQGVLTMQTSSHVPLSGKGATQEGSLAYANDKTFADAEIELQISSTPRANPDDPSVNSKNNATVNAKILPTKFATDGMESQQARGIRGRHICSVYDEYPSGSRKHCCCNFSTCYCRSFKRWPQLHLDQ